MKSAVIKRSVVVNKDSSENMSKDAQAAAEKIGVQLIVLPLLLSSLCVNRRLAHS
jgi:hypothetical protein